MRNTPDVASGLEADSAAVSVRGIGTSYREMGRRAAAYVRRILAGTAPVDLPVETVSVLVLATNLKTAKALGLTIPTAFLDRADEIIE